MREFTLSLPDILALDEAVVFGQWLVDNRTAVLSGERVAEVLSAGVLVYVTAPVEGTLIRSNIMPGTPLAMTSTLGIVLAGDEDSTSE